jgi:hypothetical protein
MEDTHEGSGSGLTWASFGMAVVALAGSLYLSIGMELKACPLCFYQRTFVMAVVGVLGIGLLTRWRSSGPLSLLALPAVVGGLGVAGFHVYLEQIGKLECPGGILGIGTSPQQSLAAYVLLFGLVAVDAIRKQGVGGYHFGAVASAVILGGLFTWGAIKSSPPMPPPPTKAYDSKLDICRPPYKP